MFISPKKSIYWGPNHQCGYIWRWGLKEKNRLCVVVKVGWYYRISILIIRDARELARTLSAILSLPFTHHTHQGETMRAYSKKVAVYQPRGEPSPDTNSAGTFTLIFNF